MFYQAKGRRVAPARGRWAPVPLTRKEQRRQEASRRTRGSMITMTSAVLVLFVLLAPNQLSRFSPAVFLRVPVEGLVAAVAVAVLPVAVRRQFTWVTSAVLGLLVVGKILDLGFFTVLYRPFDVLYDWTFLADGAEFLTSSFGAFGAVAIEVLVVLVTAAVVVLIVLSVLRVSQAAARNRRRTTIACGVLTPVWVVSAVLGLQAAPGEPLAAAETYQAALDRVRQIGAAQRDQAGFAAQLQADSFRNVPPGQLLTGLRGKDVVLAFVESYGRVALDDPEFAGPMSALLASGDNQLRRAGFASRSAYVTSPTFAGGSWLAQSTLLSGVWTDNQHRYQQLVSSNRMTLNEAFRRAGWRTVGIVPGVTRDWPESGFFGFDRYYDAKHLGYAGPRFNWSPMPDQYTLAAFQRLERSRRYHAPVMAEIPLTSSHIPWSPLPSLIDWGRVGDGSVYGPMAATTETTQSVLRDSGKARAAYLHGIGYSLSTLVSYVTRYGDDDLVVVFVGDHQPSSIVTGEGANRQAPITIVARDKAVLEQIAPWGWTDGLNPGPKAPVWRMDSFRDRFLTAFGPRPGAAASP